MPSGASDQGDIDSQQPSERAVPEDRLGTRWTPEDYVIYGQLCNDRTLIDHLDSIRAAVGATAAVLLVSRMGLIFRSMIRVADVETANGVVLRKLMTNSLIELNVRQRINLPDRESRGPLAQLLEELHLKDEPPYQQFLEAFDPQTPVIVRSWFPARSGSPYAIEDSPAALGVILVGVDQDVDVGAPLEKDMTLLAAMVNASTPVRTHRWNRIFRRVDAELDHRELEWEKLVAPQGFEGSQWLSPARIESAAGHNVRTLMEALALTVEKLLGVATELTGSSVGHIYLAPADRSRRLELIAEVGSQGIHTDRRWLNVDTTRSVVTHTYSGTRALLINDLEELKLTHPNITYREPTRAPGPSYAELSIPITQSTAAGDSGDIAVGVLNVEKVKGLDRGRYTLRDLQILRHVAIRFCLWRSRLLNMYSAHSLARLTRGSITPATENGSLDRRAEVDPRIPLEFHGARTQVADAIRSIYGLTRSFLARVYLVSRLGDELVLYCDHPGETGAAEIDLSDFTRSIPLRDWQASATAWVARSGVPFLSGNIKAENAFRPYPGLLSVITPERTVLSSCCMPIFVSGRLIGALSMLSEHTDAYQEQKWLILAIAEQLGLTFAHERRRIEQSLFSTRSHLAPVQHELAKTIEKWEKLGSRPENRLPPNFLGDVKKMRRLITPSELPGPNCPEATCGAAPCCGTTLHDITRYLVTKFDPEHRYLRVSRESFDQLPSGIRIRPGHVPIVCSTLSEALLNCLDRVIEIEGKETRIHYSHRLVGGIMYCRIHMTNPTNNRCAPRELESLYRVPFRRDQTDRLHLGTFIAGSLLRSIGGEVILDRYRPKGSPYDFVKTTLEIPVERSTSE
jgi:hypothetical protein